MGPVLGPKRATRAGCPPAGPRPASRPSPSPSCRPACPQAPRRPQNGEARCRAPVRAPARRGRPCLFQAVSASPFPSALGGPQHVRLPAGPVGWGWGARSTSPGYHVAVFNAGAPLAAPGARGVARPAKHRNSILLVPPAGPPSLNRRSCDGRRVWPRPRPDRPRPALDPYHFWPSSSPCASWPSCCKGRTAYILWEAWRKPGPAQALRATGALPRMHACMHGRTPLRPFRSGSADQSVPAGSGGRSG
jgi:hypothetical protein